MPEEQEKIKTMLIDMGPVAFNIFGVLQIHWLGFFLLIGILSAASLTGWLAVRQGIGLTRPMVGSLLTWMVIASLLGARLGYCLFYQFDLLIRFKSTFPYWGFFAFGEGGFSWHGAVLGAVFGGIFYSMKSGLGQLYLFDLAAFSAPIIIFFSRIGSFLSGEILGTAAEPGTPVALKIPTEIERWQELPEKLQAVSNMGVTTAQEAWLKWSSGDSAFREAVIPLLEARHPVQIYGALLEGAFIFLVLFALWKSPRRNGVISAVYLILSAAMGLLVHHFEWPEPSVAAKIAGLDKFQWLSLSTFVLGIISYILWTRTTSIAIPGWGRGTHIRVHRRNSSR